ncbi:MAG: hypothetical protein PHP25_02110 [Candidatus Moranbacteria bacterium]|nr:hypothetical protein [Candidatus Moranbacteria bacterium]
MFDNLEKEASSLFTLFQASMALVNLYLALGRRKSAAYHLLLADGRLQDLADLLDEKMEIIVKQSGTDLQLDKFTEWKRGAAAMKAEITELLSAMGLN